MRCRTRCKSRASAPTISHSMEGTACCASPIRSASQSRSALALKSSDEAVMKYLLFMRRGQSDLIRAGWVENPVLRIMLFAGPSKISPRGLPGALLSLLASTLDDRLQFLYAIRSLSRPIACLAAIKSSTEMIRQRRPNSSISMHALEAADALDGTQEDRPGPNRFPGISC